MKKGALAAIAYMLIIAVAGWQAVDAGAKRITDYVGNYTVSTDELATDTSRATGVTQSEAFRLCNPSQNQKYDWVTGWVYVGDFTNTYDTALGNTDTAIIALTVNNGYQYVTLATDTGLPPCSLSFIVDERQLMKGATALYGDSTAGVWEFDYDSPRLDGFAYDWFYLTFTVADSARTAVSLDGDSVSTATINWHFRFIEDE